MKNFQLLFVKSLFILSVLVSFSCDSYAQLPKIKFIFGTRSHPNGTGDGCDGDKGICIIIRANQNRISISNPGVAEASINQGKLEFKIIEDASPATADENYFYVYSEKVLDPESSRALGYEQVTILPGKYPLSKKTSRYGSAVLSVRLL